MPFSYQITSVGKELPGFSTMIAEPNDEGDGEVSERFVVN